MAETKANVMEMVRDEIQKNPTITTKELFEKAKKLDRSMSRLSIRQFNARYPLQIKRNLAPKRRRRGRPRKKAAGAGRNKAAAVNTRDEIRSILLQFARDVAAADGKADVLEVVARVDGLVDRVATAVGKG